MPNRTVGIKYVCICSDAAAFTEIYGGGLYIYMYISGCFVDFPLQRVDRERLRSVLVGTRASFNKTRGENGELK